MGCSTEQWKPEPDDLGIHRPCKLVRTENGRSICQDRSRMHLGTGSNLWFADRRICCILGIQNTEQRYQTETVLCKDPWFLQLHRSAAVDRLRSVQHRYNHDRRKRNLLPFHQKWGWFHQLTWCKDKNYFLREEQSGTWNLRTDCIRKPEWQSVCRGTDHLQAEQRWCRYKYLVPAGRWFWRRRILSVTDHRSGKRRIYKTGSRNL